MKNDLNVLKYGITCHSPRCWLGNIKLFFRNLRYAYQRITQGHAECDIWDMDSHLSIVMSEMLIELAEKGNGYPTNKNEESWREELKNTAMNLYDCCEESDEYLNELDDLLDAKAMAKGAGELNQAKEIDNDIRKLMDLNEKYKDYCKDQAFDWLKDNWYNLWD